MINLRYEDGHYVYCVPRISGLNGLNVSSNFFKGMKQFSASMSNAETVGRGMRGLNFGTENHTEVDENWSNDCVVDGEEDKGDSPSSENNHIRGVFFCDDENGGAFLTRLKVAKHLSNSLLPRLSEIVQFKDLVGNVHNIGVTVRNGRQCFEHGLLQMMEFYNLHQQVHLYYTYTLNDDFNIKISRPHGVGEIHYHLPEEIEVHDIPDDPEEVLGAAGRILWTIVLTKAHVRGRQGLVLPVRIVTGFLDEDQ
ncbi:B3 domain-containing protein [Sesbania bispinosa]|nr:B3 domain-containing protein [Sesbania bispinosa]